MKKVVLLFALAYGVCLATTSYGAKKINFGPAFLIEVNDALGKRAEEASSRHLAARSKMQPPHKDALPIEVVIRSLNETVLATQKLQEDITGLTTAMHILLGSLAETQKKLGISDVDQPASYSGRKKRLLERFDLDYGAPVLVSKLSKLKRKSRRRRA